jgi:hypothetical protein
MIRQSLSERAATAKKIKIQRRIIIAKERFISKGS